MESENLPDDGFNPAFPTPSVGDADAPRFEDANGTCGTLRVKKRAEDYECEYKDTEGSMKTAAICFLGMLCIALLGLIGYVVNRLFF